jgi:hypothetical protein
MAPFRNTHVDVVSCGAEVVIRLSYGGTDLL